MNRYPSYKTSGLEWLGEIPSHWELSSVGKYFSERNEKVDDISYPPLSVTMNGVVDQLSDVSKSDDGENRKLVLQNDFVINSRSDRKGSSGISPRDGSVSLINIVLQYRDLIPPYVEYLFKGHSFKEEFFRNGKGIHWDLWTTRWDQLKNISIPIPPLEEQSLMYMFLDKRINQIESLIEMINLKIQLLKEERFTLIHESVTKGLNPNVEMIESGYELIPTIPKHWTIKRISHLYQEKSIREFPDETNLSVFRDYGVVRRGDHENRNVLSEDLTNYKLVDIGDLVLNKMKCWMGSLGVSPYRGIVSPAYIVLSPRFDFYSGYIHHLVRSKKYIEKYGSLSYGVRTGQWDLRYDDFKEIKILIPPLDEQKEISRFLDSKLSLIDRVILKEEERVSLLKEFIQSLVSSVVSGKVRVTKEMI